MPNPQTNLRLDPAIRDKAIAAAKAQGIAVATLVERALVAYLDRGVAGDSNLVAGSGPDSSSDTRLLSAQIADLIARVEILESRFCPSQDAQEGRSKPFQVSQHPATAPTEGHYQADGVGSNAELPGAGVKVGDALIAAGAPLEPHQCRGDNRSRDLRAKLKKEGKVALGAAEWLQARGWVKVGKDRWAPPQG